MSIEAALQERSGSQCEMCGAKDDLVVYAMPPKSDGTIQQSVLLCKECSTQVEEEQPMDVNHWRCLNDSMWNEAIAVQVLSWRMLARLRIQGEAWAGDLLDMMYLEDADLTWAKSTGEAEGDAGKVIHKDANGVILEAGDTVTLIKDLAVKGSSLVAKRGTAVRRISLDPDNENHIEGRVEGQRIVILTEFVKKTG